MSAPLVADIDDLPRMLLCCGYIEDLTQVLKYYLIYCISLRKVKIQVLKSIL